MEQECNLNYYNIFEKKICKCNYPEYKNGLCVFHYENVKEKRDDFNSEFEKLIHNCEIDNSIKYLNFSKFIFPKIILNRRIYTKEIRFQDCIFTETTDFRLNIFKESIIFQDCTFLSITYFINCIYLKHGGFFRNRFSKDNFFFLTKTKDYFSFELNEVFGELDFSNCKFRGATNFQGNIIYKESNFTKNTFFSIIDFSKSKFLKEVVFDKSQFKSTAKFNDCEFDISSFYNTKFLSKTGEIEFKNCKFSSDTFFDYSKFYIKANFFNSTFLKIVDFNNVDFKSSVIFDHSIFFDTCSFINISEGKSDNKMFNVEDEKYNKNNVNSFQYIVFYEPEKVFFNHVDLSRCLFNNTDLRKINFIDVKWYGRFSKRCGFIGRKRNSLYTDEKDKKFRQNEQSHQQLKLNYENNRDYHTAGDFHYWELNYRLFRLINNGIQSIFKEWPSLFILILYKYLFRFGQSYFYPSFLLLGIILLTSVLYYDNYENIFTNTYCKEKDFFDCIVFSIKGNLGNKLQLKSGFINFLSIIQTAINFIFASLIVVAVRREFKR